MDKPAINDNSPDLQMAVHRLNRVVTILKVLVNQIDILETMTSMDFLDFRDYLRPASGFQSWQFKIAEAKLGLKFDERYGQQYYISQLRKEQVEMIRKVESRKTLLEQVNTWLERMPFFSDEKYWKGYSPLVKANKGHVFWDDFEHVYINEEEDKSRALSPASYRAALFIMLYRGYPLLHLPFQFLTNLIEIDEQMSTWRFRHISMVHRMIGSRIGTGGSSGKEYLKGALDKHFIFKDLVALSSFLIERRKLPKLTKELEGALGFN
jgi:tryptophan 2,3-dioxygenase